MPQALLDDGVKRALWEMPDFNTAVVKLIVGMEAVKTKVKGII
jgi:hypothetical protein